jgi:peptide/nickel transport system permease protein
MTSLKRFLARWSNRLSLAIVASFVFIALAAPLLAPRPDKTPVEGFMILTNVKGYLPLPPNPQAALGSIPMGTFNRHLDVRYSLIWGARSALQFGLTVALLTTALGVILGAFSAYLGGLVNSLVMRITDAFLAFPVVVGVVFIQQLHLLAIEASGGSLLFGDVLEPASQPIALLTLIEKIDPLLLAMVLFSWMAAARLTNTEVRRILQTDYILAAQATGVRPIRLVFRHLIPNAIAPAIILLTRDIGGMVLLQAALTFIGIGGGSLWGELLVVSRRWIIGPNGNFLTYWWTYLPVTLTIILFGVGWSLLGDGLNDWLNPRSKRRIIS